MVWSRRLTPRPTQASARAARLRAACAPHPHRPPEPPDEAPARRAHRRHNRVGPRARRLHHGRGLDHVWVTCRLLTALLARSAWPTPPPRGGTKPQIPAQATGRRCPARPPQAAQPAMLNRNPGASVTIRHGVRCPWHVHATPSSESACQPCRLHLHAPVVQLRWLHTRGSADPLAPAAPYGMSVCMWMNGRLGTRAGAAASTQRKSTAVRAGPSLAGWQG